MHQRTLTVLMASSSYKTRTIYTLFENQALLVGPTTVFTAAHNINGRQNSKQYGNAPFYPAVNGEQNIANYGGLK